MEIKDFRHFLGLVYGDKWRDVWVCALTPDEMDANRGWTGRRLGPDEGAGYVREGTNNYFCIGLMDENAPRRANDEVREHYLVIADDVGTKVDPARWETMMALGYPEPFGKIETSPGNWTYVWLLREPVARGSEGERAVHALRQAMVRLGLTDAVQDDARYIRLPCGVNSKKKYRGADGAAPRVTGVLTGAGLLDPEQGCVLLLGPDWKTKTDAELGLTPGGSSHAGALHRTADLSQPDPYMQLGIELGMDLKPVRPGVVEALCPNIAQHGDRAETGFAFLGGGLMECNHAHCQGLRSPDFQSMMRVAFDARQEAKLALGMLGAGEARTAKEFLARASFADLIEDPAVDADEVAGAVVQIERDMVLAELGQADALETLARRFVYVEDACVMYDTVTRRRYQKESFAACQAVIEVIPSGSSGAKHAFNRVRNHPAAQWATAFVYLPCVNAVLVDAEDATTGRKIKAINTWVPSPLVEVQGMPTKWLAHVEHLFPDVKARTYWLDWLASVARGKRTSVVPIIVGPPGVGKDMMLSAFYHVLGRQNVETELTEEKILSSFNGWKENHLLVLAELRMTSRAAYERFKELTSGASRPEIINKKFQQPYPIIPQYVTLGVTNNMDAITCLDPNDRRVWVHEIVVHRDETSNDPDKFGTEAYFQRLADALDPMNEPGELGRLAWYLRHKHVVSPGFNPFAPAPDFAGSKQDMLIETLPAAGLWVRDAAMPGGFFDGRELLTTREVEDAAYAQGGDLVKRSLSGRVVRTALTAAGWRSVGRVGVVYPAKDGKPGEDHRVNLWLSPVVSSQTAGAVGAGGKAPKAAYEADGKAWHDARLAGAFPSEK